MADSFQPIIPKIGDVVLLQKTIATVMYIGPVHWNTLSTDVDNINALYVGLELPDEITNGHNGTYDNILYFRCKLKHGIILPVTCILKIISPKELLNKLSAFKAEVNILNIETEKLRQEMSQFSQINKNITDDDDIKQKEIDKKKMIDIDEFNEIKKENQEYKAKIVTLEIQKNEISNKLNVINTKKEEKENEINKLTETLNIKQKQIEQLMSENNEIQKQKNVLISEHCDSENQYKKEKNDLLKINENQQNKMKEKDKKYQTKIEEIQNELNKQKNEFETEINQIKQEKNESTQKLNYCNTKIKEIERESVEKINNLNETYDENILKLKNLLNEEKEKEVDLKSKNSKIKKKLKIANKEKDNLLLYYERRAKEAEIYKIENENLEEQVETHKIENKKLRKMLKKLNQNTSNKDIKSPRSVVIQWVSD